ncbi:MAG TPA: HXXEE domain-containing protein [Hyphomicrobiales bacterium]|nr:HXXEE domain-containing protein [Hyphomicrobiales bacterium]
MAGRLYAYWVYGGVLAGIMLLALMPLFAAGGWSVAFTSVFLLLPLYMLHQYEEHDADRFRLWINRTIGGGAEVLTPAAVFVINIGAVWALDVVVIYLAARVDLGLGLIAAYLMLLNALIHIAGAIRGRSYNPGLITAIVLFLPASIGTIAAIDAAGAGSVRDHLIGIVVAIAAHGVIVAYAVRRRRALRLRPA